MCKPSTALVYDHDAYFKIGYLQAVYNVPPQTRTLKRRRRNKFSLSEQLEIISTQGKTVSSVQTVLHETCRQLAMLCNLFVHLFFGLDSGLYGTLIIHFKRYIFCNKLFL